MRFLPRAILAGGAGFAVSLLAACGGGAGLLSGDQSNALSSRLDQISSNLSAGNCRAVGNASSGLVNDVANLPSTINRTLRSDLNQGAQTVTQLAIRQCRPRSTSTTTPTATTIPPTTASTATTPPTTSTSSTPTTPTSTTPTATTPTSPGTTSTQPTGGGGLIGGGQTTGGGAGGGNGQ
jgi:hypothetical protein